MGHSWCSQSNKQLETKGLGWAVPWEGARVYGARAWEGTKNLVEYKSLEGDRDLGVGWAA